MLNLLCAIALAVIVQAPNDPYFPNQAALEQLHVPQAWEVTTGSAAVVVAQFDTGVAAHPDLGANVVLDGLVPYSPLGTWSAGIVCATTDNGIGIAGVCQHLTLNAYRTIWSEEHLAESFTLARATAAKIGLTGYALAGWHARHEFDLALDGWYANGQRILICPAGDTFSGGTRLRGPNDSRLLVVGALDGTSRAAYSNWGSGVDLWAPGHGLVTDPTTGDIAATDSTRCATAYVAGIAGLLLDVDSTLTGAQVQAILVFTADPLPNGDLLVNARAAVAAAQP